MNKSAKISEIGLAAVTHLVPLPGFGVLINRRLRKRAQQATGLALLGAGALVAVPLALYVICKTSPKRTPTN